MANNKRQRNSDQCHNNNVVNNHADILGVVQKGQSDISCFPGKKKPNNQEKTFPYRPEHVPQAPVIESAI